MRRIKLTKYEKSVERDLLRGMYVPVGEEEAARIARAIEARRKDAVLNIRVNSQDLENLKQKAKKHGVPYQTFIGEILHRYAQ